MALKMVRKSSRARELFLWHRRSGEPEYPAAGKENGIQERPRAESVLFCGIGLLTFLLNQL